MKTYENENSEQELSQSNGETTDKVSRLAHSKANNSNPQPNSAPNNNNQTTQELDKADIQPTNNNQNLPNKEAGANDNQNFKAIYNPLALDYFSNNKAKTAEAEKTNKQQEEPKKETAQTKTEENETLPPPQVTWKKGIMSSFYIGGKKGEFNVNTSQKDVWSLIPPNRRKTRQAGQFVVGDIIIEFEDVKLEEHPNLRLQRVVCYFVEESDIANLLEQRPIPGKHTDIKPTKLFMKECAGLKTGEKMNREKAKDTGVELLFNLCASKEGYLYQVANNTNELVARVTPNDTKQEENLQFKKTPYLDQSGENGIRNLSTTPRNEDEIDQWKNKENMRDAERYIPFANGETRPVQYFDASPKRKKDKNGNVQPLTSLFDGITTVSKDVKWYQGEEEQARSTVVFHELWENYERTTNLEPYQYTKFDANNKPLHENALEYVEHDTKKGAHRKAVDAENGFYAKSKTPGAFTKAIDIKTGKIIKLEENKK